MHNNNLLDPIQFGTATDRNSGDKAAATASRLEMLALVAELTAPKGYTSDCVITYRVPGQEFPQTHTVKTDYAGIWKLLRDEIGNELDDYGITCLDNLLSPASPIKMAFGRLMPGETFSMPDRLVTDGNSPALIESVATIFAVVAASHDTDGIEGPNDL